MSISPGSIVQPSPEPQPPQQSYTPAAPVQRNWFQPAVIIVLVVLAVANFIVFYDLNDTRKNLEAADHRPERARQHARKEARHL